MNDIIIRPAKMDDLATLLLFEQGVITAERPYDNTLKRTDDTRYYDIPAMIEAPNIELLVAVLNDELIGSGYARIEEAKQYSQHRLHAYLGFMYVDPAHRGKGINKMIIDALEKWSLSKNVTEMRLDVYVDNIAAIRAYERTGFSKLMILMRKGLKKE